MKKTLLAAAVALAASFAGTASAQGGRLLGVAVLDDSERDRDRVFVECRPRVAAVKLRSVGRTAEIQRLSIRYGNGERDIVRLREVLPRGEETGWIDLPGGRRCVTAITVVGDAERGRGWRDDDDRRYRRDDVGYDGRYDRDYRRGPRARVEIYGAFR